MLDFVKGLNGLSVGQALDMTQPKIQIRRWQQREEAVVRCANQTTYLRMRRGTTDAEVIWQCFVAD